MPIVHVHWTEGRTEGQKAAVAKGITDTVSRFANVSSDRVFVLFYDIPATNVSQAGQLVSRSRHAEQSGPGVQTD